MGKGLRWQTRKHPLARITQQIFQLCSPLSHKVLLTAFFLLILPWNVLARPYTMETPEVLCPSGCLCSPPPDNQTETEGGISCVHAGLTSFPPNLPTSFASLDLHWNQIVELGNLSSTHGLQFLDVSHNALTFIPSGNLNDLVTLKAVNFSFNAISVIAEGTFEGLAGIETLDLAHNRLTSLNSSLLLGLQNLKLLNLSGNLIVSVSKQTFHHLSLLEVLDLSYNRLESLPEGAFQGLESAHTILLQHNSLLTLSAPFTKLDSLTVLDLSYNTLRSLENYTLGELPGLSHLRLSFNNVTYFSPTFCGNSSSVKTINLTGNSLQQLEGGSFLHFPQLEVLDLSRMPDLQSIAFDAFSGAASITTLNLSSNPLLSFLHPQLFETLSQLTTLDLRSDNLQTLSHVTFHANPHLTRLYLADNPWQCGCGLAWLTTQTSHSNANTSLVTDLEQVQCQLQSNQSTVPVTQLSQETMQCKNVSLVNVTDLVSAKIGSQLVLSCEYDADETSVLTWTTPRGLVFHYHPFHPDATSHLVDAEQAENLTSDFHKHHPWHWESSYDSSLQHNPDHIVLLSDGSLYVDYVLRNDAGPYVCTIHNAHHNASANITLRLDQQILFDVKIMSLIAGMGCAASFFTLNTVYVCIMWAARKLVNKRRRERINKLLVSLDDYRGAQIARIRANYSYQLGRIRDQYHAQSTRLKDNYTVQVRRVRQGCSNQVERIRDNYHTRLTHLKDYSSHQIQQIRDATNNQIVRIRDYGSLQMDRLKETYKLQQQHVLKVIEAMNLENCRTVVESECLRTESMIFDVNLPDLDEVEGNSSGDEVYSNLSQSESVYATALNSDDSSKDSLNTVMETHRDLPVPADSLIIEVPPHSLRLAPSPVICLPSDSCSYSADGESSGAEDDVKENDSAEQDRTVITRGDVKPSDSTENEVDSDQSEEEPAQTDDHEQCGANNFDVINESVL